MISLSISLFNCKSQWHKLLGNGISVFVKNNPTIKGYRIEFNHLSGENLRLALLTYEDEAEELAKSASIYFNKYFRELKTPKIIEEESYSKGLFMQFPINSIQFGLFPPETINKSELEKCLLPTSISKAMLSAFQEEIDHELTLTFAFYLHITIIKTYYIKGFPLDKICSLLRETVISNDSEDVPVQYEMYEITEEIMKSDVSSHELDWLNEWYIYCLNNLPCYPAAIEENVRRNYLLFNNYLNMQLGITQQGKSLLSLWVRSSITQYLLTNRIKEEIL